MRLALIVGARPQFIKAAPVLRELEADAAIDTILVHTGQHFDANMSEVFFRELGLREPDHHLGVHSGSHGEMTGRMIERIEACLLRDGADVALVFGDTNTTLAGALAAVKAGIPAAHVEAGLRSWNRTMPEEINRVLVDHCSKWLFCPTDQAVRNLQREGLDENVYLVGDVMYDAVRMFSARAMARLPILERRGLAPGGYFVLTVHRAYNTEDAASLRAILSACGQLGRPVLFPVHPRTRPLLEQAGPVPANVLVADPLGYLDMLCAVKHSRVVLTDSGGLQKEAYFLGVPCVTLRPETEWVESVAAGWNVVAGTDEQAILAAIARVEANERRPISCYGDGRAAERIRRVLVEGARVASSHPAAATPAL